MSQSDSNRPVLTPWLTVGDRIFRSRVLIGVEQYSDPQLVGKVLQAANADAFITTFDLARTRRSLLLSDIAAHTDLEQYVWIGTTSFAHSAKEAVETCRILRSTMGLDIIKLDVRGTSNLPEAQETLLAAKELLQEGFTLLPFIIPEVEVARTLVDMGCSALRLMASPVGSFKGLLSPGDLTAVIEAVGDFPTVIEGGLGTPEHVERAFELGCTAVLVNTMVAASPDPVATAVAVRKAAAAYSPVQR